MMEFEQNRKDQALPTTTEPTPAAGSAKFLLRLRRVLCCVVAVLVSAAIATGGYYAWSNIADDGARSEGEEQGLPLGPHLGGDYRKWERPLVALVISGQMHGYIHPCGCSHPQYGGLERRYNFIESLVMGNGKEPGWDVVGIDLGELAEIKGIHAQNLLKFELSMKALGSMRYHAVGIGDNEIRSPLAEALGQVYDRNRPLPRPLGMSLAQTAPGQSYYDDLNIRHYEIAEHTKPKIGVISMIGPDMREMLKTKENFLNNSVELPKALKALGNAGVEIGVILHHEHPSISDEIQGLQRMLDVEKRRREMARMCAEFCAEERRKNPKVPVIHLIVLLTDEPEPPALLKQFDPKLPTHTIEIGHKGKYAGLVGIYRDGKGYRLQYQIVPMGPEWATEENKKNQHPVIALSEEYNLKLKRQNMLAQFPRSMHYNQIPPANEKGLKATFVGSSKCSGCHPFAYKTWRDFDKNATKPHGHFHATTTLEELKHPSNRQFDPECMMCHTVGLKHPGGYHDPVNADLWPAKNPVNAAALDAHNKILRGVGCESCHGPCSEHVKNQDNKDLYPLINPFGPTQAERNLQKLNPAAAKKMADKRLVAIESQLCKKCHDSENDVHWGEPGFEIFDKWAKIAHPTPVFVVDPPPKDKEEGVDKKNDVAPKEGNPPAPFQIEPGGIPAIPLIELSPEKKK